jgi:hypothetical protein
MVNNGFLITMIRQTSFDHQLRFWVQAFAFAT